MKTDPGDPRAVVNRMVVEACRRLHGVAALQDYFFVSYGEPHFARSEMFHNAFGITQMATIRPSGEDLARARFNSPYTGLDLRSGFPGDEIPDLLPSSKRRLAIVWLEYDRPLDETILLDLADLIQRCEVGSLVLVSVAASIDAPLKDQEDILHDLLGGSFAVGSESTHLKGWRLAALQRKILQDRATTVARQTNSGGQLRQLFNFQSKVSGVGKTLTWGGVIQSSANEKALQQCDFSDLGFVRDAAKPFSVGTLHISQREIDLLTRDIFLYPGVLPKLDGVAKEEIETFAEVYRYLAS
jgi:hypothetical protein